MDSIRDIDPYTVLAAGYDFVMEHVDYEAWADYIHELITTHHDSPDILAELGCGTGSLAIALHRYGHTDYLATDVSNAMLDVARRKAEAANAGIRFAQADFSSFRLLQPVDVLLLLYDGMNYLLDVDKLRGLFASAYQALNAGGILIVDQSTPSNSLQNEPYFEDQGEKGGFSYRRRSQYDADSYLHTTTIEISVGDDSFRETHVQKAYTIQEIERLIHDSGFDVLSAYDGFSLDEAHENSERIHWVLRRPPSSSR